MPVPKVETGPTKGKELTRNKNGQWRRKRSDAGKKEKTPMKILTIN